MVKKVLRTIIDTISIIVIIIAIVALLTVVMTKKGEAPNFLGYSVFRVATGSMEPEIPTNSMIVVKRVGVEKVQVGDVISFYSNDPDLGGAVNTHRVMAMDDSSGVMVITTKGDANHNEDEYPVYAENLIGVVIGTSHAMGIVVRLASNPLIFVPFIVVPLLIMLIMNMVTTVKTAKQLAREEEEEAVRQALELLQESKKRKEEREGQQNDAAEETKVDESDA